MNQDCSDQVLVGQVAELYPGKNGTSYIGITASGAFAPHHSLICSPADASHPSRIEFQVSTIEISRQRTNVVKPGDSCAVRPSQKLKTLPNTGWRVFARAVDVHNATTRQQTLTARPVPPREVRQLSSHMFK